PVDHALRVRVEVVARLEVRGEEEDEPRPRVVRARPVVAGPERVAQPRRGGADVGVRVVPVDAPGLEHAVHVALVAGPPDVVEPLVVPALLERRTDARADLLEHLLPAHPLPAALTALPGALERVQDALGVLYLVDGRGALRAVPAARGRVQRVALELAYAQGLAVDVGEQAAGRLAVEADGGHEHVAALDAPRPGPDVVLAPVVPLLCRRVGVQRGPGRQALDGHVRGSPVMPAAPAAAPVRRGAPRPGGRTGPALPPGPGSWRGPTASTAAAGGRSPARRW